jgi:DNA-binding beta-propeller fold protein YncE
MRTVFQLALLLITAAPASAQIAMSSNDGKQNPDSPTHSRDSVTILDLSARPVRTLATLEIPTSMIGPPASVALAPNGSFAIVTSSLKRGADGSLVPNDTVSVVNLSDPSKPELIQSLKASANASGVAINPNATLALVANRTADSVTLFKVNGNVLTSAGDFPLGEGSTPLDVAFSADGRSAYVVLNGKGRLVRFDVRDGTITLSGKAAELGHQPYSLTINDASGLAYVTNLGGRHDAPSGTPRLGTLSIVELAAMRELEQIDVGITPEHVSISPHGDFVEVNLIDGSIAEPGAPNYRDHGFLTVFEVKGRTLKQLATTQTGKWCQGAAWNDEQNRIFLQCADQLEIEVYEFDGTKLARNPQETISLPARPGSIATASDR